MGGVRFLLRKKQTYRTRSNKIKVVKTPGARHLVHYRSKIAKGPK